VPIFGPPCTVTRLETLRPLGRFTTHGRIFDTTVPWLMEARQLFFSVKIHKIKLSFVEDECQQFILMENLLSVSDLGAPS